MACFIGPESGLCGAVKCLFVVLEFSVFPWLSLLFIQRHLVDLLEQCAKYLERAERYEVMGEMFKLAIPIYEQERDFRVRRGSLLVSILYILAIA